MLHCNAKLPVRVHLFTIISFACTQLFLNSTHIFQLFKQLLVWQIFCCRHGSHNVRVFQRYYNRLLHHPDCLDCGPVWCHLLSHVYHQTLLVKVRLLSCTYLSFGFTYFPQFCMFNSVLVFRYKIIPVFQVKVGNK